MLISAFCTIAAYAALAGALGSTNAPWSGPAFAAPLGYDEFGRNLAATLLLSAANSVLYGLAAVFVAGLISLLMAAGLTTVRRSVLAVLIDGLTHVVEAIPVLLWVVALAVLAPTAGRTAGLLAFVLATAPFLTKLTAGELSRIQRTEFIAVARSLEMPLWQRLRHHILPNATLVLAPALAQIFGLAVAIDGAIAIAGSANRSELSLGVLLIRGKENFIAHPHLLLTVLFLVGVIYALVAFCVRRFSARMVELPR
ncbi:ABC transporter permease subunit [Ralstonia sp.]|uniref:ABC transporter permease subunit n=1 Tax=Ralstonia sp. TaxID=54061 RepID=UPI00257E541E|nr:ABC transporter permease subunit [Ralstonia sp.]